MEHLRFDADVRVDEMLVEIHAGTIDSNLNEIHQSWLSLIVGEQLFGRGALDPSREPVAKRFLRRLYDENFYIFHKEPNIHDCTKCASNSHSFASMVVLRAWKIPQTRSR